MGNKTRPEYVAQLARDREAQVAAFNTTVARISRSRLLGASVLLVLVGLLVPAHFGPDELSVLSNRLREWDDTFLRNNQWFKQMSVPDASNWRADASNAALHLLEAN